MRVGVFMQCWPWHNYYTMEVRGLEKACGLLQAQDIFQFKCSLPRDRQARLGGRIAKLIRTLMGIMLCLIYQAIEWLKSSQKTWEHGHDGMPLF